MNEELNKYLELLKPDRNKKFSEEFIRTTNLERKIVDNYGFEGVKLILDRKKNSDLFELGEFPKLCPWYDKNKLSKIDFIRSNFEKIESKIAKIIDQLISRCEFIYVENANDKWECYYFLQSQLYDERRYFKIYFGGAPIESPLPNNNLKKYGWELPKDLIEFYSIHNGFGNIDGTHCVLGNEGLEVKGELMNSISLEIGRKPNSYSFDELLDFYEDGGGNSQSFIKDKITKNLTADWDHETWEISGISSFYEFIDRSLSEIDEE